MSRTPKFTFFQLPKLLLLIILLTLTVQSKVPREERRREKYYNSILQESLEESTFKEAVLKYDEEGFYLSPQEDYAEKELIALIKKEHIISGCEFYPFRDQITGLIVTYTNNQPKFNRDLYLPIFTLVYQMLYSRFGNKEKAYKFYSQKLKQPDQNEFYNYDMKEGVKEYMLNMPIEEGTTVFHYTQEEIKLISKLGLSLSSYNYAMGLFDFVLESITKMKDELYRETMLPFVNQRDYFKKYYDYIFRNGSPIKVKEYSFLYPKELQQVYTDYNFVLANNFKFPNTNCVSLIPLFDLMRHSPPREANVNIHMIIKGQYGLGLALDKNFDKNSKFGITINEGDVPLNKENLFLLYGQLNEEGDKNKEFVSVPFTFKQRDFVGKRAHLCNKIGCGGFNIDYLARRKVEEFEYYFSLDENVNYPLLNIFKILEFNVDEIDDVFTFPIIERLKKLESAVEVRAISRYVNLIRDFDSKLGNYVRRF